VDPIEKATWALVIATSLLVVAAAFPAYGALAQARRGKKVAVSRMIPELGFLRDRLARIVEELLEDEREQHIDLALHLDEELEMLAPLTDQATSIGFALTEELLLCRHLVTQAGMELDLVEMYSETGTTKDTASRQKHLARAVRLCLAGSRSVEAAALLLPRAAGRYRTTSFGDRLAELSREREASAEKELVDRRYATRKKP